MPVINHEMRAIVRDGYERGIPIREIAVLAGSTYHSVRAMGSRLKLVHPSRIKGHKEKGQSLQEMNWERARKGAREALRAMP